ncbi:hypothetical protein ACFL96_13730, partial [Thermoproteota archaeon]
GPELDPEPEQRPESGAGSTIKVEGMPILGKPARLLELRLIENNIREDGALAIGDALQFMPIDMSKRSDPTAVRRDHQEQVVGLTLDLGINPLGYKGALALTQGLKHQIGLWQLMLPKCNLGNDGLKVICEALYDHKQLEALDLRENNIDFLGAQHIANLLNPVSSIQHLYISDNKIGDAGVQVISKKIKSSLLTFDIANTACGEATMTELQRVGHRRTSSGRGLGVIMGALRRSSKGSPKKAVPLVVNVETNLLTMGDAGDTSSPKGKIDGGEESTKKDSFVEKVEGAGSVVTGKESKKTPISRLPSSASIFDLASYVTGPELDPEPEQRPESGAGSSLAALPRCASQEPIKHLKVSPSQRRLAEKGRSQSLSIHLDLGVSPEKGNGSGQNGLSGRRDSQTFEQKQKSGRYLLRKEQTGIDMKTQGKTPYPLVRTKSLSTKLSVTGRSFSWLESSDAAHNEGTGIDAGEKEHPGDKTGK